MGVLILVFGLGHPGYNLQRAHVDVVELNHVLQDNGEIQFSQIIVWRWMPLMPVSRHAVSEWFLVTNQDILVDHWHGYQRVTWRGDDSMCYAATCRTFKETRTFHDPEMLDRRVLPANLRRPYFNKGGR